jgi:hypothetical protein
MQKGIFRTLASRGWTQPIQPPSAHSLFAVDAKIDVDSMKAEHLPQRGAGVVTMGALSGDAKQVQAGVGLRNFILSRR